MTDDEMWDYAAQFVGHCTCDHKQEEHGWGGCDVDGCPCGAGWEE